MNAASTAVDVLAVATITVVAVWGELTIRALSWRWPLQIVAANPAPTPKPAERIGEVTAAALEVLAVNDQFRCHAGSCGLCQLMGETVGRRP